MAIWPWVPGTSWVWNKTWLAPIQSELALNTLTAGVELDSLFPIVVTVYLSIEYGSTRPYIYTMVVFSGGVRLMEVLLSAVTESVV